MTMIKSPYNYTGGKYELLEQLFEHFPKNQIRNYIEPFAGGYNVGINVFARKYYINDTDTNVMDFYKSLTLMTPNFIISKIENIISEWKLTNSDAAAFYNFRKYVNDIISDYNNDEISPENIFNLRFYIFILSCFSFNSMIRYNKDGQFNNTFGRRRYNKNIAERLLAFIKELNEQQCIFSNKDFEIFLTKHLPNDLNENDFVYLDPPYLSTQANYCLNNSWTINDEERLYKVIDKLNEKKVKFALSNLYAHKGVVNERLKEWVENNSYNVYHLDKNYDKVQLLKGKTNSDEILVTNFK